MKPPAQSALLLLCLLSWKSNFSISAAHSCTFWSYYGLKLVGGFHYPSHKTWTPTAVCSEASATGVYHCMLTLCKVCRLVNGCYHRETRRDRNHHFWYWCWGWCSRVYQLHQKGLGWRSVAKAQQYRYQRLHGPNSSTISAWDLHFPPKIRYSCQHNSAQLLPSCIQHRQQNQ